MRDWITSLAMGPAARAHEREFLPAALEVVETPASPTGRALSLIIVLFFMGAVAWAFLGKVDELATAPGQIVPAGEVKTIQPLDPGVVRAIDVQDGDHVAKGQLLLELDPTQTAADQNRLSRDLMQAQLDVARLSALKLALEGRGPARLTAPAGAPADLVQETRLAMQAQADQQAAKLEDLTQQIEQKQSEIAEGAAETDKINASIPLLADKEKIHRDLTDQGYGNSLAYLDAQQQLSDARYELQVEAQKISQARDAQAALRRQQDEARFQYATDLLGDLRKAEEQRNELSQELVKAGNKLTETELRSPIDGVVQQLSVHTLHGVVTPAEHLMTIVPDSHRLMIEARLENRDVGFVHAGQPVKIKIETFTFTRYGLLDGQVVGVSRDAVSQDQSQQPGGGATTGAPAPTQTARSPSYMARISLSKTSMIINGQSQPLRPGMSAVAEIKTGRRTIIDYLLSPIARRTQESLHER